MNIFIVLLSISFLSIIGFALIREFGFLQKKDTILAIGASYGIGVGLAALQLYLYYRFSIPWQREFILVPLALLLGVLIVKKSEQFKNELVSFRTLIKKAKITKWRQYGKELLLLLGILLSTGYVLFEALLRPVVAWDAWSLWLLYPKMFFIDGRIALETLRYTFSGYPMTISLLDSFIYISLGRIDDTAVLLTSSAFYIFLAISFFAVLKGRYGVKYALLFTFLLVTTQNFIRHGGRLEAGLADLPLGYFAFLSVELLFNYFKNHSVRTLFLFVVFASITSLIKYEGIPLACIIALCAFIYIIKNRSYKHLPVLLLWIVPLISWQLDRKLTGIENIYFSEGHMNEFGIYKSINAFLGTFKELVNFKTWNLLWLTYFYTLFAFGVKKQRELAVLHFIIVAQLIIYLIMYNVTYGNNPESSIGRLLMHIAPLAFYSIAISLQTVFFKKKTTSR